MTDNICFLDDEARIFFENSEPLFKISSLLNSIASLQNQYIWFNSPNAWKDSFEKLFYTASYKGNPFGLYGKCFVSCFSPIRVQEPQWRMYGDDCSLCFEYNKATLLSSLLSFCTENNCTAYIGFVHYKTTSEITKYNPISEYGKVPSLFTEEEWVKLLFFKRNAFLYEHELRIVLVYHDKESNSCSRKEMKYTNRLSMINSILIDPITSNSSSYIPIQDLLTNTFGFKPYKGKNGQQVIRVKKSKLYTDIKVKHFK